MPRFIHLTDSHIGDTPYFALYGKQTLAYLQRAVHAINELPFDYEFVLHTGDLTDGGTPEAYRLYKETIARLRKPIYHVAGNHDAIAPLQKIVLGRDEPLQRLDEVHDIAGIRLLILDTRGPVDPAGRVNEDQLAWLRSHCTPEGPPLVIAMHHVPVSLDTPWLDAPPPGWDGRYMYIDNAADVLAALRPARGRLRGVFCGHVHGTFQVMYEGILIVAGQSCFAPLITLPDSDRVYNDRPQRPMFNIVTVTDTGTIVRQRCLDDVR